MVFSRKHSRRSGSVKKVFLHLKHHFQGKLNGKTRSGRWHTVRNHHLVDNPSCAVCGGKKNLEVHHKKPFHLHPELELDQSNLITLCEAKREGVNCHLFFGHLGNYRDVNLTLDQDIFYWAPRIKRIKKLGE